MRWMLKFAVSKPLTSAAVLSLCERDRSNLHVVVCYSCRGRLTALLPQTGLVAVGFNIARFGYHIVAHAVHIQIQSRFIYNFLAVR